MTAEPIDAHFRHAVLALTPRDVGGTPDEDLLACFQAQLQSRHLDLAARWLRSVDRGYYTIGSAGHEANAAVALALRPTDPALLHYRSGGFYAARATQVPGSDAVGDVLRSLSASVHDPISGGRHKVFGNHALAIIPQTSTIGSHLPRAFGVAFALGMAGGRRGSAATTWAPESLAVCSFGDASANHSTAVGALNAAAWCAYRGVPLPVLLVCEDNGIGISTRTPAGWIQRSLSSLPSVRYEQVDGQDTLATLRVARDLAADVRRRRAPAVLHLRTVRFMGHAGSDAELGYRSQAEVSADHAKDPLLGTAQALIDVGLRTPAEVLEDYEQVGRAVRARAQEIVSEPRLSTSEAVRAPLSRRDLAGVLATTEQIATTVHGDARLPRTGALLTLAQAVNAALTETMIAVPGSAVFGQDVSVKGGVYGVTKGLRKSFGATRVFDTLLDEQTILGSANGLAVSGWLPIPEIQYLAYLHNALDQLRGEAATLSFFSDGQYTNGMVVRVAGLAYQKGFGGHFHNDNSVAALRDIPGLHLAVPADAEQGLQLMRECVALARGEGRVCVFLEPIAQYHEKNVHEQGDNLALTPYAPPDGALDPSGARRHGDGRDLLMVTFGNGVRMSRRVAQRLAEHGVQATVLDLRWLAPLPLSDLLAAARSAAAILVVDETRQSGGVSESILTALVDAGVDTPARRVTSDDSFIPLGPAADTVLLDEERIQRAAQELCRLTLTSGQVDVSAAGSRHG